MFDIKIDDVSSTEVGILVMKRPSIPAPMKKYKELEIPGKDGKLYVDYDVYDDINIDIEFNYMISHDKWSEIWRKVKKWLSLKGERKLLLSDDHRYYRVIKKITLSANERESFRIGKFTATFTVEPYEYLVSGSHKKDISLCKYNSYDICKPTFYIKGEGLCYLTVNQNEMRINMSQDIIINTKKQISYKADGSSMNANVKGNYNDLYLLEGHNEIFITDGFEMQIIPNWRCI